MQVLDRISEHLYDYYGSTESNSMTVLKPRDQRRYTRSVGQPFHNVEIRIVNDSNNDVANGEPGEVLCRNPSLMTEYLDNEEATTAAFLGDWYRTGDIGHLDEAGYLYLVGRKGEMIISGGINIYPAEIENTLMSHPDILDCAVIGLPDEKWGQCVAAYVVPRDGCQIKLHALQKHCQNVLADYKKPRVLHIVPSLPKNAGGKTVKTKLV
jgi:acyl-CoA synthetase (AMP-forming)/AMP-acid ligase II